MGESDFCIPEVMEEADKWFRIMDIEYKIKLFNSDLVLDNLRANTDYNFFLKKEIENSECDQWCFGKFYNRNSHKAVVVIAPYVKGKNMYESVLTEFADIRNLWSFREILEYVYDCNKGQMPCDETYTTCMKYYLLGCEIRQLSPNYNLIGKIDAALGFYRNPIRPLVTSIIRRFYE